MDQARVETGCSRGEPTALFGPFELRLRTGELRKHGVRVRLQAKPFYLLRALVEQAGDVITREELKEKLWPSDTFVDFESGLNTAVNRLRTALGDSAENPIYVETLSRIGYRFVAPVEIISENSVAGPESNHIQPPQALANRHDQIRDPPGDARSSSVKWVLAGFVSVFLVCVAGVLISQVTFLSSEPSFRQLTFRNGAVYNARFVGQTNRVVLSATWNGDQSQVFLLTGSRGDPQNLGIPRAHLAGLSPSEEIGVITWDSDFGVPSLETAPLRGGSRHKLYAHTTDADWSPDGTLCLVKNINSSFIIEFPPGRKIYSAKTGWISDLRVFSKDRIAFAEHPLMGDDAGQVMLLNSSGKARVLSSGWASLEGLSWYPSGREVWFTAAHSGVERALVAVDLNGNLREVARSPGGLRICDIARSGQVLIARTTQRMLMTMRDLAEPSERDISWLDWSRAAGITSDKNTVLFDESGSGGGRDYGVYLYKARTNSTQRIGSGRAMDISRDGRWVVTMSSLDPTKLSLVSVVDGKSTPVATQGLAYHWAKFFADNDSPQILLQGNDPGNAPRVFRQRLPTGNPEPLNIPPLRTPPVIDQTGRLAIATREEHELTLFDLITGDVRSINSEKPVYPIAFVNDNEILAAGHDNNSTVIEFLNLKTGKCSMYRRLDPPAEAGVTDLKPIYMAGDLRTVVYSRMQDLSDLFLAHGLR